jgi:hypothetical protein
MFNMKAIVDPLSPGSRLDADHPENGVLIPCRNTAMPASGLIASGTVVLDGSRFKAVNARGKNFTPGAIRRRMEQVDASIERYPGQLETSDRQENGAMEMQMMRLTGRIDALRRQMRELQAMAKRVETAPDRQVSLTDPDARTMAKHGKGTGLVGYNVQAAVGWASRRSAGGR